MYYGNAERQTDRDPVSTFGWILVGLIGIWAFHKEANDPR